MFTNGRIKHFLFLFLVLWLLWVLLTGTLDSQELITGGIAAFVAALLSIPYLSIFDGLRYRPTAIFSLLTYLLYFFYELIRANFDLARRVLTPSLPISPAFVEIETSLQSDLGKMLLANSITLTPGTLSVDLNEDRLMVHWINAEGHSDLEQATRAVAAGFEKHIAGFLK